MMEKCSKDQNKFDEDVRKEYRNYYMDFSENMVLHQHSIVRFYLENS